MDRLRDLIGRFFARVELIGKGAKTKEDIAAPSDTCAEKVAKVQQAIRDGEEVQHVTDLVKPLLRRTLHDLPPIVPQTTYAKERPWFDKNHSGTRGSAPPTMSNVSPTNTWNRLEAFLSTTDPNQLSALDPSWNKSLPQAPDDRPQPKRSADNIPIVRKPQVEEFVDPIFREGSFSNSISGVF